MSDKYEALKYADPNSPDKWGRPLEFTKQLDAGVKRYGSIAAFRTAYDKAYIAKKAEEGLIYNTKYQEQLEAHSKKREEFNSSLEEMRKTYNPASEGGKSWFKKRTELHSEWSKQNPDPKPWLNKNTDRTARLLESNPSLTSEFVAVGEEGNKHIIPRSYLEKNKE